MQIKANEIKMLVYLTFFWWVVSRNMPIILNHFVFVLFKIDNTKEVRIVSFELQLLVICSIVQLFQVERTMW